MTTHNEVPLKITNLRQLASFRELSIPQAEQILKHYGFEKQGYVWIHPEDTGRNRLEFVCFGSENDVLQRKKIDQLCDVCEIAEEKGWKPPLSKPAAANNGREVQDSTSINTESITPRSAPAKPLVPAEAMSVFEANEKLKEWGFIEMARNRWIHPRHADLGMVFSNMATDTLSQEDIRKMQKLEEEIESRPATSFVQRLSVPSPDKESYKAKLNATEQRVIELKKELFGCFVENGKQLSFTQINQRLPKPLETKALGQLFDATTSTTDMREKTFFERRSQFSELIRELGGDVKRFQAVFDEYRRLAKAIRLGDEPGTFIR